MSSFKRMNDIRLLIVNDNGELRSNVADWTAEDLWKAYMQLTEAEAAFRIQKDELRLRPISDADWVRVHEWARREGTGRIFDSSTGFKLPNGATRSPDVSWVVNERLERLTE